MNLKQFQRRNIITDVAGLIFFQNRDILYTVSTEAIISCPMKFSAMLSDMIWTSPGIPEEDCQRTAERSSCYPIRGCHFQGCENWM